MDITFKSKKLREQFNKQRTLYKHHGQKRAKRIQQRLADLSASEVLEDMRNLPGRCHELKLDRAGQLSLDLDHPYRLIFEAANDPVPKKVDGGLDWKKVTAIRIIGVEDTHE